jgi:uncharacterized membrane protein
MEQQQSSTGLDQNVAGLLCYLLGFITGIIFLVLEKNSRFVKFHAMQSIVTFGGLFVLSILVSVVLAFIPFIGLLAPLLGLVIWIGGIVLWILLMIKAYSGEMYKLPIAGDIAEKQIR